MQTLLQDIRYSARMLAKGRGMTLIAVLTLAVGIGASTLIFSVVNSLILHSPHVADAERVVAIWRTAKDRRVEGFVSYLELQDWRSHSRSFETIAAYKQNGFIILDQDRAETLQGLRVTANFLSLLRVNLLRGRDFQADDEKAESQPVVIISHQFWQSRLGGSESALGQQLTLNGRQFEIVGILPPGYEFPLAPRNTELITTVAGEARNLVERGAQILRVVGRLKPDVTVAQAQADLVNVAENLEQEHPRYSKNITAYLVPLDEQIVGLDVRRALWVLLGAVGFLLLIACTNVTNLLLL